MSVLRRIAGPWRNLLLSAGLIVLGLGRPVAATVPVELRGMTLLGDKPYPVVCAGDPGADLVCVLPEAATIHFYTYLQLHHMGLDSVTLHEPLSFELGGRTMVSGSTAHVLLGEEAVRFLGKIPSPEAQEIGRYRVRRAGRTSLFAAVVGLGLGVAVARALLHAGEDGRRADPCFTAAWDLGSWIQQKAQGGIGRFISMRLAYEYCWKCRVPWQTSAGQLSGQNAKIAALLATGYHVLAAAVTGGVLSWVIGGLPTLGRGGDVSEVRCVWVIFSDEALSAHLGGD